MFTRIFVLASVLLPWSATAMGAANDITFYKDVLPILQKNCQTCHRQGQIAPMALTSYKEARPWAKAMKAAVLARKMPPWCRWKPTNCRAIRVYARLRRAIGGSSYLALARNTERSGRFYEKQRISSMQSQPRISAAGAR